MPPFVRTGAARTRYYLVITSPEESSRNNPSRERFLKITVDLPIIPHAILTFASTGPLTDDLVAREPVAAIEDDNVLGNACSCGIFDEALEEII